MIQLDRHQPASLQTVTYKSFKFAPHSLFCCHVCERIVTTTEMVALGGTSHLTAVSTAVRCVSVSSCILIAWGYSYNTGCPTRYGTWHFFNNSNTNEDIATEFEQEYVCCVRNEEECVCSPFQILLQYPH